MRLASGTIKRNAITQYHQNLQCLRPCSQPARRPVESFTIDIFFAEAIPQQQLQVRTNCARVVLSVYTSDLHTVTHNCHIATDEIGAIWPSRLTRIQGLFKRAVTCSIWDDLPLPVRALRASDRPEQAWVVHTESLLAVTYAIGQLLLNWIHNKMLLTKIPVMGSSACF